MRTKIGLVFLLFIPHFAFANICDRTPQVVKAVEDLIFKNCSAISAQDLLQIRSLNLWYKDLTSLQENDFQGLDNLVALDISVNKLAFLPERVFYRLKNVEKLDLSLNKINYQSVNALLYLSNLKLLNLTLNDFSPQDRRRLRAQLRGVTIYF